MLFHIRLIIVMFFIVFLFLGFFCTLLSCYIYPPPVQTNPQRFLHPPPTAPPPPQASLLLPPCSNSHSAIIYTLLLLSPILPAPIYYPMVLRNHPPTHNPLLPDPPSYCPAQSPPLTPSRFRTPFSPTISTH